MTRRQYTPEQKAEAIALYATHGPTEVQNRLGILKGTVTTWAKQAGVQTSFLENATIRVRVANAKWEERRLTMAHDLGNVAALALTRTEEALTDGKSGDAKNLATTMAILVDKAQLLTGGATSRIGEGEKRKALADGEEAGLRLVG